MANALRRDPVKQENALEVLLDSLKPGPKELWYESRAVGEPCSNVIVVGDVAERASGEVIEQDLFIHGLVKAVGYQHKRRY